MTQAVLPPMVPFVGPGKEYVPPFAGEIVSFSNPLGWLVLGGLAMSPVPIDVACAVEVLPFRSPTEHPVFGFAEFTGPSHQRNTHRF